MKRFIACLSVLMLLVSFIAFVDAQEKGKQKGKAEKSEKVRLQEYSVVGLVQSKEVKNKKGETKPVYSIKDKDGTVFILQSKGKKAEKYNQYVGKKVKVVGEGVVLLKNVTSIEEAK